MFFRVKPGKGYRYLQIAHSVRRGKTVRQEIIATLGRLDVLQASGQLESLMRGGLRYCEKIKVMDPHAAGKTEPVSITKIGPGILGSPRCTKDLIEESLFDRGRDLFSEVGLVFFDTTSIYFEGAGDNSLGRHAHSKDHRPDLHQMIVGIALDVEGRPICCEMWPGNTADAKSLVPVVERMRAKFRVRDMCLVADRGFVSEATLEALGKMDPPVHYVIGVRMRRTKEVGEVVLQGSRFLLRGEIKGHASQAVRAVEVALLPVLQELT